MEEIRKTRGDIEVGVAIDGCAHVVSVEVIKAYDNEEGFEDGVVILSD